MPVATETGFRTPPPEPSYEALPSDLAPALVKAIDLRRSYGLRHDLAYVRAVATDPRATNWDYGSPLYPEEFQDAQGRFGESQGLTPVVIGYAASHAAEFGGMYIDEATRAGLVTLWTDHIDEHAAAIRKLAGPDARLAFGQVRNSEADLRSLQDLVANDMDGSWLDAIPARIEGVGVDIRANRVSLDVSSANPDAAAIIGQHFGLGDRLQVHSDGTGVALLPRGTVKGTVIRPDGRRARNTELEVWWDNLDPGDCGGGDIGYGVRSDGTFELPCQIGSRRISIIKYVGDDRKDIGAVTVEVKAGETVDVTIRLSENP